MQQDNRYSADKKILVLGRAKKRNIIAALFVVLLACAMVGTFAWFFESTHSDIVAIKGSVEYADFYFDGGDGSEDSPYQIHDAQHFSNFAWLQYLGVFNKEDENGNITQVYFKLTDDIDMNGVALPPIGTSDNPFVGNFDGDGYTISGVVTSNRINGTGIDQTTVPSLVDTDKFNEDDSMNIIGLFGVVGQKQADSYNYDTQVNQIKNLNIRDCTVITQTSETLVGMAAGYVNGTLSDVTINGCTTQVTTGGATALGSANGYTNNLSDYGTVGYCTQSYKNTLDVEKVEISKPKLEISSVTDTEQGDAWGGSINMVDMHTRLTNVYNAGSTSRMTYYQSQVVNLDETDGSINVVNGTTATISPQSAYYDVLNNGNTLSGGSLYSYPSTKVADGDGGNYALHPSSNGQYIGVLGRPSDLDSLGTLTINRYLDEFKDAYYIVDGEDHLNVTGSGAIDNANFGENTKWVINNLPASLNVPGPFNMVIYTIVDGKHYYLANDGGTLTLSETADNSWEIENGNIYSIRDGQREYLLRGEVGWMLTDEEVYNITDRNGNYLNLMSDGTLTNGQNRTYATRWYYDNTNFYLYTIMDGNNYYLFINPAIEGLEVTDEDNKHHVVSAGADGIYNVNEEGIGIGQISTIGTVNESGFVDEDTYIIETGEIKSNETYVILARETNGTSKVLFNGGYTSTRTDQVSIDSLSCGNGPIVEGTRLNLLINASQSEEQQTWVAHKEDDQYSFEGVASEKYIDLTTETTSNSTTYLGDAEIFLSMEEGDSDVTKHLYQNVGRYVDNQVRLYRETDVSEVQQYVGYYYDGDSGYELITGITRSNNGTFYINTINADGGTPSYSQRPLLWVGTVFHFYRYDESVLYKNYLVHNNSTKFYTSKTTTGNNLYFFKKVKSGTATQGTVQVTYLDVFIQYAQNMLNTPHDSTNELWMYLEDMLEAAIQVRDMVSGGPIDIDDAREQQVLVNTVTKYLKEAILLLEATKYYVAFDEEWYAVDEGSAPDAALGVMTRRTNQLLAAGQIQEVEQTIRGAGLPTFFPINGQNTAEFNANPANTGYVCGANTKSGYQSDSGDIRVSWFPMSSLSTALNSTANYSASSNLQVLTRTAGSGGLVRVDDEYNNVANCNANLRGYTAYSVENLGLQKYVDARRNLQSALLANPSRVYGLHFMDALISEDVTFIAPKATINGVTYTNYEMPEACIDFKLKERGYINFFAGSYYTNSGKENNSFFALYEIDRNGKIIESIKEIFKIYGDPTDPSKPYKYTYSAGDTITDPGYQLMFDTEWIKNPGIVSGIYKSMFYYEIPTNAGEYALGSVENKFGAYLVYLDISANKQEVQRQKLSELTKVTRSTYEYPLGIQLTDGGYTADTDSVSVKIPAGGTASTTALNRTGQTTATVNSGASVSAGHIGDGITLTDQGANTLTAVAIDSSLASTYKETLFDYNTTTTARTKTEDIVKVAGDGSREYKQYINGVENGEVTGTGPEIQNLSPICITYHYVLPDGATVENTSTPTNLSADGMYLTGINSNEYPSIGADPVDVSNKITGYNVVITPTETILMRMDQVLDLFRANVNGQLDMRPGQSKTIN